jgi:mannose-6-phosphate isomerase-like protein (cupin superfamily)
MEQITADQYMQEPVRYPSLRLIDLIGEGSAVTESYQNSVLNRINDGCLRLSVLQEQYPWHQHPHSDELFLVLEGSLRVEFKEGSPIEVGPLQALTVPAGVIHRTCGVGRTVTLCFEKLAAETVFLE